MLACTLRQSIRRCVTTSSSSSSRLPARWARCRGLSSDAKETTSKATTAATAAASSSSNGSPMGLYLGGAALLAAAVVYQQASSQSSQLELALQEKLDAQQAQLNALQVDVSGKTNQAFVFIKPHAAKGPAVEALVEDTFKANGIRVTDKGELTAETIDENMLIDTHYGAIASKAVKLKPSELTVPDKAQLEFQQVFGESWESAVAAGKVYNAKDGAQKLGLDSAGLNAQWGQLTRGKTLLKFGGGFYCGKVADDVYIMNGFYMNMRAAYCTPGEKIVWYSVQWPTDTLSWSEFRGQVLGPTDPSQAPKTSIRRQILDQYKSLGLKSKPNTGDNGVHASASPLEGLAERVNWLGASIETDSFGKGLLAKGLSKKTIETWSGDCQVKVEGETVADKTMSVFDTLEDLNADESLEKVAKIQTA